MRWAVMLYRLINLYHFCLIWGSPGSPFEALWGFSGRVLMSWQLYLMRRLRGSASVSYFFVYKNRHLIFYARAAYIRFSGVQFDVLASLFGALAAQIRVGVLFYLLCKNRHLLSYAQAAYIRAIIGFRTVRRSLVDAQAAQICVGVIFSVSVFKQTHHLSCAGCVHTRHR